MEDDVQQQSFTPNRMLLEFNINLREKDPEQFEKKKCTEKPKFVKASQLSYVEQMVIRILHVTKGTGSPIDIG